MFAADVLWGGMSGVCLLWFRSPFRSLLSAGSHGCDLWIVSLMISFFSFPYNIVVVFLLCERTLLGDEFVIEVYPEEGHRQEGM